MNFISDLVRWFWQGTSKKNDPISQSLSNSLNEPSQETKTNSVPRNKASEIPDLTSKEILGDLQSLSSITKQFDQARQELITELQRLAPPKKRNPFWEKDAA